MKALYSIATEGEENEGEENKYKEVVTDLLNYKQNHQTALTQYKRSRHRYKNVMKLNNAGEILLLAGATIAESTEKSDPEGTYSNYVKIGIAASFFLWFGISNFAEKKASQKKKARKKEAGVNDQDIQLINHLRTLIIGIGKLKAARRKDRPPINVDEEAEICINEINKLPQKIKELELPQKEALLSLVVQLFPNNHPIRTALEKYSQPPDLENPVGPFVDVGQKAAYNLREDQIKKIQFSSNWDQMDEDTKLRKVFKRLGNPTYIDLTANGRVINPNPVRSAFGL